MLTAIAAFGLAGKMLWVRLPLFAIAGGADLASMVFRATILQLTIPDSMRGSMRAFHSMVAAIVNSTFSVISGGVACLLGITILGLVVPQLRSLRKAGSPT